VQVSLQRALRGLALLPRDYPRGRLPLRLSPLPQHFSRVAGRPAWDYLGFQGCQAPAALRPVAGFPGPRLLWRLRRPPGFTGGLSPPFQGSLSRSWLRTLRGRLGCGYRTCPCRSSRNPERRRGRSGLPFGVGRHPSSRPTTRATSWNARHSFAVPHGASSQLPKVVVRAGGWTNRGRGSTFP
jgi:hypothetical protein